MKILVLKSSGNKKGSSAMLADEFIKGAKGAGHILYGSDYPYTPQHKSIDRVADIINCNRCHDTVLFCRLR